ncbi:DUF2569 family protein [Pseudomonadota bacterium]
MEWGTKFFLIIIACFVGYVIYRISTARINKNRLEQEKQLEEQLIDIYFERNRLLAEADKEMALKRYVPMKELMNKADALMEQINASFAPELVAQFGVIYNSKTRQDRDSVLEEAYQEYQDSDAFEYVEKKPNGDRIELDQNKSNIEITDDQKSQFYISGKWLYLDTETLKHHPLFGAGGWMAFLRFTLIVGPIAALILDGEEVYDIHNLFQDFGIHRLSPGWKIFNYFWFEILSVISLAWSWWVAFQFGKTRPQSLKYYYTFIVAMYIWIIATGLLPTFIFLNFTLNVIHHALEEVITTFSVSEDLTAVIWILYLFLSTRVNVTYRHRVKLTDPFVSDMKIELPSITGYKSQPKKTVKPFVFGSQDEIGVTPINEKTVPGNAEMFSARLALLKKALDDNLITASEYESKKKKILDEL